MGDKTGTAPDNCPLDADYARSVVEHASKLERVQRMLQMLPPDFVELLQQQSDDFLYGAATLVQAMHDLIGDQALAAASAQLGVDEENLNAVRLAKALVGTIGLMEAIGLTACQELTVRNEQSRS